MNFPCKASSLALAFVALLCVACASPPKVRVDKDSSTNFAGYKTFGWLATPKAPAPEVQPIPGQEPAPAPVNTLAESGYFGQSDNAEIKPVAKTGAKGDKVQALTVEGVHLCCPGCVKAVDRAVKNTEGATGHTAKKNAETFVVSGDFNDQKFFEELQKEGLSGKVAKAK